MEIGITHGDAAGGKARGAPAGPPPGAGPGGPGGPPLPPGGGPGGPPEPPPPPHPPPARPPARPPPPPPQTWARPLSLGSAEKLSFRADLGGSLGAPELFDDAASLEGKIDELAEVRGEACARNRPGLRSRPRGARRGPRALAPFGVPRRPTLWTPAAGVAAPFPLPRRRADRGPPRPTPGPQLIRKARSVVAFTGAGISTSVGIPGNLVV